MYLSVYVPRLGFLFEPYVIVIFPILLKCIANSNDLVRDGAKGALAVIMNKLTAHGMRQVLAPVLNGVVRGKCMENSCGGS